MGGVGWEWAEVVGVGGGREGMRGGAPTHPFCGCRRVVRLSCDVNIDPSFLCTSILNLYNLVVLGVLGEPLTAVTCVLCVLCGGREHLDLYLRCYTLSYQ